MKKKQRKVFITWFISHISILLIASGIIGAVYVLMARTIEKQIGAINREILLRGKHDIESEMENLEHLAVQISMDELVTDLAYRDQRGILEKLSDIREIVSELKRVNAVTPSINDIKIYFSRSGLRISAEGMETDVPNGTDTSGNGPGLWFRTGKSVFPGEGPRKTAYIDISLSDSFLRRYLFGLEQLTDGALLFADTASESVLSFRENDNKNYKIALQAIQAKEYRPLPQTLTMEGESYIVDAVPVLLPEKELQLVSLIPLKDYLLPLISIRRIATAVFLTSILIGFAGTFYFTKRNYRPLRELVAEIAKSDTRGVIETEYPGNEFDYVADSFREVYTEKDELVRLIHSHGREMKNAYYSGLMRGGKDYGLIESPMGEVLGLAGPSPYVRICLFDFEDVRKDSALLLPFMLQEAADSIEDSPNTETVCVEIDGRAALLFFTADESADDTAVEKATRVHKMLQDAKNISATCVIGKRGKGKEEMSRAYGECVSGLEYRFIYGPGSLIKLDEIRKAVNGREYSIDKDLDFVRHIRGGNKKKAVAMVSDFLRFGPGKKNVDLSWAKYSVYNTVGLVMKALESPLQKLNGEGEDIFSEAEDILKKPASPSTVRKIIGLVERGCDYFDSRKKSHNAELNEKIKAFIDEHIHDVNLCHTMIADAFGMNTKYCSRFYKEQNGVGINDYIHSERIKTAKKLLKKGLTIKEISEFVGYGHIVTFIRIFKRFEGVPPGKFRESRRNIPCG